MKKIILTLCFVMFPFVSFGHNVTVVYTGNSYSSLYPCGHCPASVGGGVARRSTVIKDVKAKNKNVLIVDAGNFSAGGAFDEASINASMDEKRSLYDLAAMEAMGYDAVALGESDFNFGEKFIGENAEKYKFKILSANVNIKGVLPYFIKEFKGFKIAVIGLSYLYAQKKEGINVENYETALSGLMGKIKGKADLIILLSSLGDKDNNDIANKFPDIKLIISSGKSLATLPYEKINDTIIMKPSYRAKEVRMANLEFKTNKISNFEFKKEPLSLNVKEDEEILKIIPACFQDGDCSKKEGLVQVCQNPGGTSSLCVYYEPKKFDETLVITDKNCEFCTTSASEKALKDMFLGMSFKAIDYNTKEGKELLKKYSITTLPAFILPQSIKNEKNFSKMANFFEYKNEKFIAKSPLSGVFLFLNRKEELRKIDFFMDIYDKSTFSVFNDLITFASKNKINLVVHFVLTKETASGYPQEEIKIIYAVKKLYPDKFIDYLKNRLKDIKTKSFIESLEATGIDYKKVKEVSTSKDLDNTVSENKKFIEELNITSGNVMLVNNNRIFMVFQVKNEDLEKLFNR